jgi:hypothetical protein
MYILPAHGSNGLMGGPEVRPEGSQSEAGQDMPYTPPGGDECHASHMEFGWEDLWIEQQYQSQPGILYACFYGYGPSVKACQSKRSGKPETGGKGSSIVDKYDKEDPTYILNEIIVIIPESQDDKSRKYEQGEGFDGSLYLFG